MDSNTSYPGLRTEWLDDGTIAVFTLENTRRETLDFWATTVINLIKSWPSKKPYLVIHDASQIFLTPYLRQKAEEIATFPRHDLKGAYAVVVPESVIGVLMDLFITRNLASQESGRMANVFTTRSNAEAWVRDYARFGDIARD